MKRKDIWVARVVNKSDPDFVLFEVARDRTATFSVREGDEFLTLVFVKQGAHPGDLVPFNPFTPPGE